MPQVILKGWEPGLQKVALTKLLKQRAELRLKIAKQCTDRVVAGERVVVEVPTRAAAEALAHEASELGAIVELEPVPRR